ncbi:MAG: DUF3570 domain-containing protein [Actinobacteria bacterium]|uniref:Unannotated protein n=1 Tax=freshwater metagenome TaxID=449393 RepID=A0A6J7RYM5_9ZZZZ|nr:DUF3570 domain-containing protein [Actinomycetota bacterium]
MVAAKRVQAVLPDRAVAVAVINKTSKKGILREAIKQLTQTLHEHQPLLTSDYRLTKKSKTANTSSLQSLTKAALLLPGLLSTTPHAAEGDEVNFQYSHFQEGNRNVYGVVPNFTTGTESVSSIPTGLKPIEVDSIHGGAKISLTDRAKFSFNYLQDTWSGATPIASAPAAFRVVGPKYNTSTEPPKIVGASPYLQPSPGTAFIDAKGNPLLQVVDPNAGTVSYEQNNQVTDILVSASPEVRNQGDVNLAYEWDQTALSAGGGISSERDYESRFANVNGLINLNQKHTTLNLGLNYINSNINAVLPHDSFSYINSDYYKDNGQIYTKANQGDAQILQGNRQDWGTNFGITQIINKDAYISGDVSYTRSSGYLANPYKAVSILFVDPRYNELYQLPAGVFGGDVHSFSEQRPELRNQWGIGGRYVQFINPLDASLHFGYHFSTDDWDIQTHTFEADWVQPIGNSWTLTPRIRYYSQDSASFYTPWLTTQQAYNKIDFGPDGITQTPFDRSKLPSNFSSDERLAAFGTLSGGISFNKQFAKGLSLETGFEYNTRKGSLSMSGGGANDFNNFDYWVVNAAFKFNLDALSIGAKKDKAGHSHHEHGVHGPAGVLYDHMLPKAGDMMIGYREMYTSQSGDFLNGTHSVSSSDIVNNGCTPNPCYIKPSNMSMNMQMLDLMYAPTDWLTLMLMPQFVNMNMKMDALDGAPPAPSFQEQEMISHHEQTLHQTGGVGDLGMYGLFKLFDNGTHHVHITTGFSAPTGEFGIQLNSNHGITGGYTDYGMQLGSGTWDFKPSLTYTGQFHEWTWGAQSNGTVRMQNQNDSGYALGDLYQTTAWGSYSVTNWLSGSLRGLYTTQGGIKGQYSGLINQYGPTDYPTNYGGKYWDIGFGMSAMVPSGDFAGNRVSVEWLQPLQDNVNGYQLERVGTLAASWGFSF